jgi:hypothetical protein
MQPAIYVNGAGSFVAPTVSAFRFGTFDGGGTRFDPDYVMVSVVGN